LAPESQKVTAAPGGVQRCLFDMLVFASSNTSCFLSTSKWSGAVYAAELVSWELVSFRSMDVSVTCDAPSTHDAFPATHLMFTDISSHSVTGNVQLVVFQQSVDDYCRNVNDSSRCCSCGCLSYQHHHQQLRFSNSFTHSFVLRPLYLMRSSTWTLTNVGLQLAYIVQIKLTSENKDFHYMQ